MGSYCHLTAEEWNRIAALQAEGQRVRAIAQALGRSRATVDRDIANQARPGGTLSSYWTLRRAAGRHVAAPLIAREIASGAAATFRSESNRKKSRKRSVKAQTLLPQEGPTASFQHQTLVHPSKHREALPLDRFLRPLRHAHLQPGGHGGAEFFALLNEALVLLTAADGGVLDGFPARAGGDAGCRKAGAGAVVAGPRRAGRRLGRGAVRSIQSLLPLLASNDAPRFPLNVSA